MARTKRASRSKYRRSTKSGGRGGRMVTVGKYEDRRVDYADSPDRGSAGRDFAPVRAPERASERAARGVGRALGRGRGFWDSLSGSGKALVLTVAIGAPVAFLWGRSSGGSAT